MKNWFGMECHPTDQYIHWRLSDDKRLKQVKKLREAYDSVPPLYRKALDDLLTAAYNKGCEDERDCYDDF